MASRRVTVTWGYDFAMTLTLPLVIVVMTASIVFFAFVIFGLTGFGSSITAMPFLALLFPLHFAVPFMLLLDLTAALLICVQHKSAVDRVEFLRFIPSTLAGVAIGLTLFVYAPVHALQLGLGIYVLASAIRGLFFPARNLKPIAVGWSGPMGVAGGTFTALFGTGGPFYVAYLTGRLKEKASLRATMSALVALNGITRLVLLFTSGFYGQKNLLLLAGIMLPCALVGLYVGSHLHWRLSSKQIIKIVWSVLAFGGTCLIWRNI